MLKKLAKLSAVAALFILVVSGCGKKAETTGSSSADAKTTSSTKASETASLEKTIDDLKKQIEEKDKKIKELTASGGGSATYPLDEARAKHVYELMTGKKWTDDESTQGLQFTSVDDTEGGIYSNTPGGTRIFIRGQYAVVVELNDSGQITRVRMFDLSNDQTVLDQQQNS